MLALKSLRCLVGLGCLNVEILLQNRKLLPVLRVTSLLSDFLLLRCLLLFFRKCAIQSYWFSRICLIHNILLHKLLLSSSCLLHHNLPLDKLLMEHLRCLVRGLINLLRHQTLQPILKILLLLLYIGIL